MENEQKTNEADHAGSVRVDAVVRRIGKDHCAYNCPYYQDGPVFSYCNKYGKPLKYENGMRPSLAPECKAAIDA